MLMRPAPPSPIRRLALDLGTRTGWACRGGNGPERWGVWELDALGRKGDAPKFDLFARYLTLAIEQEKPIELAVEEPFIGSADSLRSSRVLLGLLAFAQTIAYRLELPLRHVAPNTIKKATLGWVSRTASMEERKNGAGRMIYAKGPEVQTALNARRAARGLALIADHNTSIAVAILDYLDAETAGFLGSLDKLKAVSAEAAQASTPKAKRKAPRRKNLSLPVALPKVRGRRKLDRDPRTPA